MIVGVRSQVQEEKTYLIDTYGDAYRDYARRTG